MSNRKHTINIKDSKHKLSELNQEMEESIEVNGMEKNQTENPKEEKAEEIQDTEAEVTKLKELLMRKAAEFENYKKRTDGEFSSFIKFASENLIKELLPVYDDLGRSVDSVEKGETKDFETLKKGLFLIYDKFRKVLEREGLKEINSTGKEFDVHLSNALMQIPTDKFKPNTVMEVVERGYTLKDKVIKHEKVLVSCEPIKN